MRPVPAFATAVFRLSCGQAPIWCGICDIPSHGASEPWAYQSPESGGVFMQTAARTKETGALSSEQLKEAPRRVRRFWWCQRAGVTTYVTVPKSEGVLVSAPFSNARPDADHSSDMLSPGAIGDADSIDAALPNGASKRGSPFERQVQRDSVSFPSATAVSMRVRAALSVPVFRISCGPDTTSPDGDTAQVMASGTVTPICATTVFSALGSEELFSPCAFTRMRA